MKVTARTVLVKGPAQYFVLRLFNDAIWIIATDSTRTQIIKAHSSGLVVNFISAVFEITGILDSEAIALAIALGVHLSAERTADILGHRDEIVDHSMGNDLPGLSS